MSVIKIKPYLTAATTLSWDWNWYVCHSLFLHAHTCRQMHTRAWTCTHMHTHACTHYIIDVGDYIYIYVKLGPSCTQKSFSIWTRSSKLVFYAQSTVISGQWTRMESAYRETWWRVWWQVRNGKTKVSILKMLDKTCFKRLFIFFKLMLACQKKKKEEEKN